MVPFLPKELDQMKIDLSMIGLIFAIYSVFSMVGSIVIGKFMMQIGRKSVLIFGLI